MSEPSPAEHLATHRRTILFRSLLAGAAGLVPVPYLDDILAGQVRAGLVRRIADLRRVDVDRNAVAELSLPSGGRVLNAASMGAILIGGAKKVWRRVAASLLVVRRADEAMQTFQIGTLFDHYCARHHVGLGLDGTKARALRDAMDKAVRQARSQTMEDAFQRTLNTSRKLAGRLSRRFLVEKVETELAGPATQYVAALVGAFDVAWAPHKQAQLEGPKPPEK
ncbi:MAG: hypothetical protein JWN44_6760 [Myxococcales bacterium]|nr:hypothetical protein [Myxococcales bacterium]